MKRFFYRLTFLFVLLSLVLCILDILVSKILVDSHSFSGELEVMKDIRSGKAECDLAIYGSSRAYSHLNPMILEDSLHQSVYNFGIVGHTFWLEYLRHLELLKYNKPPKQIIVCLDVHSLSKRQELYNLEQFLPYMLWDSDIYNYTKSYDGYSYLEYNIPFLRYMGKTQAFEECFNLVKDSSEVPNRQQGFRSKDSSWNSDFDRAKEKSKSMTVKFDENSKKLFEQFIMECIKLEIDLILTYTPEYIEGQKYFTNRDVVVEYYKTVTTKYDLTYLDYSSDPICFDKSYFFNANHLNEKGAILFSQKFAADLKKIDSKK